MNFSPFLYSVRHALRGIALVFRTERNFRIQSATAVLLVIFFIAFPLERWERAVLLLVVMCVLLLELVNTSVERIIDMLKPRLHEYAGDVKDIFAGAVLLASVFALAIAAVVLLPRIIEIIFAL